MFHIDCKLTLEIDFTNVFNLSVNINEFIFILNHIHLNNECLSTVLFEIQIDETQTSPLDFLKFSKFQSLFGLYC